MAFFITGAFTDITGAWNTMQRIHNNKTFDDDVVSWLKGEDKEVFSGGYVSNIGNNVTIHIKQELNDADTIDFIKEIFRLNDPSLTVTVETFNELSEK